MSAIDKEPFPSFALYMAAGLIGSTLILASVGRYLNVEAAKHPVTAASLPTTALNLSFTDMPDGSVSIRRTDTKIEIATLQRNEDAFVRGVLRGLVRDRKISGFGSEVPFQLATWPNGSMTIEDLATGKKLNLRAFGPTNYDAFVRIMKAGKVHS